MFTPNIFRPLNVLSNVLSAYDTICVKNSQKRLKNGHTNPSWKNYTRSHALDDKQDDFLKKYLHMSEYLKRRGKSYMMRFLLSIVIIFPKFLGFS